MQGTFTKRKFQNLPDAQKHKKCAELLRSAYSDLVNNLDAAAKMGAYADLSLWLEMPPLKNPQELPVIADRFHMHASLANIQSKEHNLLPCVRQGDRQTASPAWPVAVYLDNIRSAHNVGSILRTVEAFSLGSVYFSGSTPYTDNKQVKDASMGCADWVDCRRADNLGYLPGPVIAMETSPQAVNLFEYEFPESFTLAMGNEEYGCSDTTLKAADAIIEIPLRGRKNSLNVANAFAIAAAEIYRQRSQANTTVTGTL